ncbi:MAG: SoxR reducing system RseC family protein [Bacteroidetes bacterium]|nr:SoxR reducing system RseC family protein [Bacteroidota bacterium]
MIDHDGIIDRIEGDVAHVKINSESACAGCHAKGVCSAADQEDKFLDVQLKGEAFSPGEVVKVLVARRLGFKAVGLGYFYPFLLLMTVLIALTMAGTEELTAGLFALLSLIPYYLALYLARKRIASSFTFSIQKT